VRTSSDAVRGVRSRSARWASFARWRGAATTRARTSCGVVWGRLSTASAPLFKRGEATDAVAANDRCVL